MYDVSLERFPSAYLLLSSCLFLLAGFTAAILYTQKKYYRAREMSVAGKLVVGEDSGAVHNSQI